MWPNDCVYCFISVEAELESTALKVAIVKAPKQLLVMTLWNIALQRLLVHLSNHPTCQLRIRNLYYVQDHHRIHSPIAWNIRVKRQKCQP